MSLLLKSEISSFWPASVTVQVGFCRTCSETTLVAHIYKPYWLSLVVIFEALFGCHDVQF